MNVSVWLVIAASAIAVVTDMRGRRIPNWLTFGLAGAALAVHATEGPRAFALGAGALLAVFALGFGTFALGWLGGGDVKLLSAAAAAFGYPDCLGFLVYTSLGGGVLALAVAAARGRLSRLVGASALVLRPFVYHGTVAMAPVDSIKLPYAFAIAFGAFVLVLSKTVAPCLRIGS
jgi:prepilin peptidase CpaA